MFFEPDREHFNASSATSPIQQKMSPSLWMWHATLFVLHSSCSTSTVISVGHLKFKCCCSTNAGGGNQSTMQVHIYYLLCCRFTPHVKAHEILDDHFTFFCLQSDVLNTGDSGSSGNVTPLFSLQTRCAMAPRTHSDSLFLAFLTYKMTQRHRVCTHTKTHQISFLTIFHSLSGCLVYSWESWNVLQSIYKQSPCRVTALSPQCPDQPCSSPW